MNPILRLSLTLVAVGYACSSLVVATGGFYVQNQEPDIGQKTQVTTDRTLETTPTWSPDGQFLYFVSDRFGGLGICRIERGGGGGVSAVTQPAYDEVDVYPDVNPLNGEIAFASNRSRGILQIWTVNPKARGLTQLTNAPFGASFPSWSPDGKEIAFSARDKNGNVFVWITNADGSNQRQLTQGTQPRWSPDGKRLVYAAITQAQSRSYDIYTIEIASNAISQITSDDSNEFQPDWSPDGRWLVYVSYKGRLTFGRSGREVTSDLRSKANFEIWIKDIMSPGRSSTQLTRSKGFDGWPRWTPKRHELVFTSDRSGSLDLWTMIPGGSVITGRP
ncbi:MAG: PD40 domain-containing protein [Acidobacteria bacterium]|nr:PD40 domain-containing protein [Acidobacteriota bacterium]